MPACVEPLAGEGAKAASGKVSTTDSIYFCQHIAIESTVRHELKTMGNTGRRIFSVVRNKQQLRFTFANQHINKTADKLAIQRIKPCSGSSRISNVGCFTSARTISARRCCPRERLWNGASAVRLSMPRISSHCCTSFCWRSETA